MITRCRPLLGTFVEITAPAEARMAIDAAFAAVQHVHDRMSFHDERSDLAHLRHAEPGEIVEVDPETVSVLKLAVALHDATHGLFEVGVGRELVRSGFLPRNGIVRLSRFSGDTSDIAIVDGTHLHCLRPILIDLGGIAKGHAVDRAVETLAAQGAEHGLVNAGGDLRMFGDKDWQVQLRDADHSINQQLILRNCAVASSANRNNRRRYRLKSCGPHYGRDRQAVLIDHRITVIAESCVIADAMTKVAMVDPDLADQLLAPHRGYVLRHRAIADAG